ncbi:Na+ dependent nucleoside transporter C-terminus-domain-containing protein [Gongronella butleri]|nr:Na+ dependent nucleoside transporter C-terminus-domain-containing protein [Gongronella butleri]
MDHREETHSPVMVHEETHEKHEYTVQDTHSVHQDQSSIRKGHGLASEEMKDADVIEYNYKMNQAQEEQDDDDEPSAFSKFYNKYRKFFLIGMWLIFTGFFCAAMALQVPARGYWSENLVLGLIYAWHSIYVFFCFVPTTIVTKPWNWIISTAYAPLSGLESRVRTAMYAGLVVVVIIVTVFSLPESPDSTRVQRVISLFGLVFFYAALFAASNNRRAIYWNTVCGCLLLQFLLALFVFRSKAGHDIFTWVSDFCRAYLGESESGAVFLTSQDFYNLHFFSMSVFPAVIFFAATVQILYYLGALQWILRKAAIVFVHLLNISGSEAVVAVASPFLGQSENILLIKPFLPYLTDAEIHQVMTSGFATVSGSVLFGYLQMGVDGTALITSCVMSIPGSVAISKIRYPEEDEPVTKGEVRVPGSEEKLVGIVHAAGVGAATGIQIAMLIAANLIALLALLGAVNGGLTWLGNFLNIQNLTLQLITGYVLVPIAWMIGASNKDLVTVGQLMATKLWANEFVAYGDMTALPHGTLTDRSITVLTYALCGFANLGSIGMQTGIITALAPNKGKRVAQLAVSACICGACSTWVSACIAGMLLTGTPAAS